MSSIAVGQPQSVFILDEFFFLVPPAIEETERVLTFNQDEVAELPCTADGFPPPKISWIRQGRAHLETSGKHQLRRSGNLVITGVQVTDLRIRKTWKLIESPLLCSK